MATNKRIDVLDVLRGIAIFGMIISHASLFGNDAVSKTDKLVSEMATLFVDGRFYTIFAILFGASFAIQQPRVSQKELVKSDPRQIRSIFFQQPTLPGLQYFLH